MPTVMRMAWLRVCSLPAPLRVTSWRAVPTHYPSCPRRSRTLPKRSMVPRKACVRDKHALRTRHTERFDLQKGLRDRNSPTCTLSQNGYGDSSVSISYSAAVLAKRGRHLLPKHICLIFLQHTRWFGIQKRTSCSGIIQASHACGPGSTPGVRMKPYQCSQ